VWVRIGPWVHGECRNGGFPDWLCARCATRTNDPTYLAFTRRFYAEIGHQLRGLFWQQGGPVVGAQLENEYGYRGPNAGAEHLSALKRIAFDVGIAPPLWSITGWPDPEFVPGEVIPVFGGYPDAFWEETLQELPPNTNYEFKHRRLDDGIGNDLHHNHVGDETRFAPYPFFTCEAGGGMQVAYHRRPVISADDIAAITLTKLGSGVNLHGYYMYQGGTHPEGRLTTLQESQATGYPNDLPVRSYDYQAPLGEFGQVNPSYRALKVLHLFLDDFGDLLAPMTPSLSTVAQDANNPAPPLRAAARTLGDQGFLFVNNYRRNYPLPTHTGVRFALKLLSQTLTLPRTPITVPAGAYYVWPINLDLGGSLLRYTTTQLVCKVRHDNISFFFCFALPGIAPEFAFDTRTVEALEAPGASVTRGEEGIYVTGMPPGTGAAITLCPHKGERAHIVVLTQEQALNCWKMSLPGQERVLLSAADLFWDECRLRLRADNVGKLAFAAFPPLVTPANGSAILAATGRDGIFTRYRLTTSPREISVRWEQTRAAAPSSPVRMGRRVAAAPENSDFDTAAVWRITLPQHAMDGLSDLFLRIDYTGDVARLYAGQRLLADDFYKGTPWIIGLKRFEPELLRDGLELKVLPLRQDAPIYLPRAAWPTFPPEGELVALREVVAMPEYEAAIRL
jgi:hypothetical protein